jgi:hypothetical protein
MDNRGWWQERLFADRSLLQIFLKSRGSYETPFNFILLMVIAILSATIGFAYLIEGQGVIPRSEVAETVRAWTALGVTLSTTVLGFLIAGFTIFATISNPRLFANMAQIWNKKVKNTTQLEYAIRPFINCFVNYITYASASVFLAMLAAKGGIVARVIVSIIQDQYMSYLFVIFFSVYLTWTVALLLKLKSFVWNIHQTMMLCIAASALPDNEPTPASPPNPPPGDGCSA